MYTALKLFYSQEVKRVLCSSTWMYIRVAPESLFVCISGLTVEMFARLRSYWAEQKVLLTCLCQVNKHQNYHKEFENILFSISITF